MTSLHPPSFHRNDFSTCSTHFSFGASPNKNASRERRRVRHAHAHADNAPLGPYAHVYTRMLWRRSVSSPTIYYGERKTIAWCPCTPPSTLKTFGEKISAEACSGKEIAGLLKKMMMMKNMMTRKIVKSRMRGFSRGKLEAARNELGLCTARYESKSCCYSVF